MVVKKGGAISGVYALNTVRQVRGRITGELRECMCVQPYVRFLPVFNVIVRLFNAKAR